MVRLRGIREELKKHLTSLLVRKIYCYEHDVLTIRFTQEKSQNRFHSAFKFSLSNRIGIMSLFFLTRAFLLTCISHILFENRCNFGHRFCVPRDKLAQPLDLMKCMLPKFVGFLSKDPEHILFHQTDSEHVCGKVCYSISKSNAEQHTKMNLVN